MGKLIEETKLQNLRLAGFSGKPELEEIMIPLNQKMAKSGQKTINGKAWWIDFKDKNAKLGISFEDAIIAEAEKELKK